MGLSTIVMGLGLALVVAFALGAATRGVTIALGVGLGAALGQWISLPPVEGVPTSQLDWVPLIAGAAGFIGLVAESRLGIGRILALAVAVFGSLYGFTQPTPVFYLLNGLLPFCLAMYIGILLDSAMEIEPGAASLVIPASTLFFAIHLYAVDHLMHLGSLAPFLGANLGAWFAGNMGKGAARPRAALTSQLALMTAHVLIGFHTDHFSLIEVIPYVIMWLMPGISIFLGGSRHESVPLRIAVGASFVVGVIPFFIVKFGTPLGLKALFN